MIKWPEKLKNLSNPPLHDYEDGEVVGWNTCRTICIEAEKNGRMSAEEIFNIIIKGCKKESSTKEIAQAIHTALYSDTKSDKTICEHIFSGGANDSSRCLMCGKFWKDIEWTNGDNKHKEKP